MDREKGAEAGFGLHPRLAADTIPVGELGLSRVLLMDNRLFPWLVLVPRRAGAVELHRLDPADRALLVEEMARAAGALEALFPCDKVNLGALGNLVPQLHVHVIARRHDDPAWPGPVWGSGHAEPYPAGEGQAVAGRVAAWLGCGRSD
ncbi:HIT domain-containing protein [Aerophototrophica crusticola]|uniref:HIT domain-containing protein n=1 Tax=Aerophototrophica crusticola TaxID=1709002 RepID=A0A858R7H8_9PROT|nr:HIT domain-containing protein [Rhodospirillaceae bacterium B3]